MTREVNLALTPIAGAVELPELAPRTERKSSSLRIGVICGLGYKNLRGDLQRMTRTLEHLPVPHEVVRNPEDVAAALDDFQEAGLDVVVVSGGDGTVAMVVTHLLNRKGSMPLLAVLEGGRTNMTAYDIGLRGDQVKRLEDILAWADAGGPPPFELIARNAIGVETDNLPRQCGFFVGGGAIYEGSLKTWAFRDESKVSFMRTGFGTGVSVAKLIVKHLVNRTGFTPSQQKILADGNLLPEKSWSFTIASTLENLVFGFEPFWGDNEGAIRLTGASADHRHLLRAATSALRGKKGRHNREELGYHSTNANEINIDLDGGVTLDGQIIHHSGPGLKLSVAGELRFLRG